jgi:alkanesulfonate monooxygenase SsuD/methylene tetrahydromethanopterin reductase-like flavin-dependent oxidoreductase (luciferase family)
MMTLRNITPQNFSADEYAAKRQYFAGNAIGGYPFVGTPDKVVQELAGLSNAGLRGIAVSFVDYLGELPYFCAEVLPRLVQLGVRSC